MTYDVSINVGGVESFARANVEHFYLTRWRHTKTVGNFSSVTPDIASLHTTKAVPPSNISLLGLVRHMARVEQSWFRRVMDRDHGYCPHVVVRRKALVARLFARTRLAASTDAAFRERWALFWAISAHRRSETSS